MKENVEEAIDRLEYVNRAYDCNNYYSRYDLDCIQILLSDYKRVLKENEELKADNYELNNRITDLLENIPVQTVKDKIRKNEEIIDISNDGDLIHELFQKNKVYEELLEEMKVGEENV